MGTLFSCTVSWIQTVTQMFQARVSSVQLHELQLTEIKALILIKNVAPSELKMTPNETETKTSDKKWASLVCELLSIFLILDDNSWFLYANTTICVCVCACASYSSFLPCDAASRSDHHHSWIFD